MPFPDLIASVFRRTGMYVFRPDFFRIAAWLNGYDAALDDESLLHGFREWLVLRLDGGNNLIWEAVFLHLVMPELRDDFSDSDVLKADQQQLIGLLERKLAEFWTEAGWMPSCSVTKSGTGSGIRILSATRHPPPDDCH
jgi:hypothetical protein